MPPYQATLINRNVPQAVPGVPVFLYGSFDYTTAPTRMRVTAVQLTSPTATVTVQVIEGNIPIVGQLVSITGAVPAYFNVSNAVITGVSIDAVTGIGTITFALTNSNIVTTASPGQAVAPVLEVGEALPVAGGTSRQVALQANTGPNNAQTIRCDVSFPTLPGAATVVAEAAVTDIDSDYFSLGSVTTVVGGVQSGGAATFVDVRANFIRFRVSGVAAGGSAKIIGKVTV